MSVAVAMLDGTYTESQLPLSLSDLHDLLTIVFHVSANFRGCLASDLENLYVKPLTVLLGLPKKLCSVGSVPV